MIRRCRSALEANVVVGDERFNRPIPAIVDAAVCWIAAVAPYVTAFHHRLR
jgi:hypothetical protein